MAHNAKQLVTLAMFRDLSREAQALRTRLMTDLGDEVIDRSMRDIVARLARYTEVAAGRKTQSLTAAEIEAASVDDQHDYER